MLYNKRFCTLYLLTIFIILTTSLNIFAETEIFTAFDDPSTARKKFDSNTQVSFTAINGNTRNSNLAVNTTITWFHHLNAYSLWGGAANNSLYEHHNSEKYQTYFRARHNLRTQNFLFTQGSWLRNYYDGYRSRSTTLITGYGRQVLNGPIHILRVEAGFGVRNDKYQSYSNFTKAISYAAAAYNYQFFNNTKFIQGLSLFANDDTTVNLETGLNIDIGDHSAMKTAYNMIWNKNLPNGIRKHRDIKMSVFLVYKI